MASSLRQLLALLLALPFAFLLAGCPPDGTGGGGDDDDATADDDDATAPDDDDATPPVDDDDSTPPIDDDDDDATPPPPLTCDGSLPVITEAEPNDELGQEDAMGGPHNRGFCYEGAFACGTGQAYNGADLLSFWLPADRTISMITSWTANADVDGYLYTVPQLEAGGKEAVIGYSEGYTSPEDDAADVIGGEQYIIMVACWDGTDGDFALTVTYDELGIGDDDDATADDDDSGDDDDSVDDDDSGDDDDSATDDDDAADDDDSAADDDDSASR